MFNHQNLSEYRKILFLKIFYDFVKIYPFYACVRSTILASKSLFLGIFGYFKSLRIQGFVMLMKLTVRTSFYMYQTTKLQIGLQEFSKISYVVQNLIKVDIHSVQQEKQINRFYIMIFRKSFVIRFVTLFSNVCKLRF